MKIPPYQRVVAWIVYVLLGLIGLGNFLNAINNAFLLISPAVTYLATPIILLGWLAAELYLRYGSVRWVSGGQEIRLITLGSKPRLALVGCILLLWVPRLPHSPQRAQAERGGNNISEHKLLSFQRHPEGPDESVVLVANFDGPEPEKYRVTETILEQLREATKGFHDVRIQALSEAVTAQQGSEAARAKGIEHKASLVLWGWYGKTQDRALVNVHLEVMKDSPSLEIKQDRTILKVKASEFESFNFQERLSSEMAYLTLVVVGLARYEAMDFDGTIDALTKALGRTGIAELIDPSQIYFYRGNCFLFTSKLDEASVDYQSSIRLNPRVGMTHNNRGLAHLIKGDARQALVCFNQALNVESGPFLAYKYNSNFALFLNNRGTAYYNLGSYDQAMADYNMAAQLSPEDPMVHNNRGGLYSARKMYELAIAEFDRAIGIDPESADTFHNRGSVYDELADYDRALSDYDHAIQLKPDFLDAYNDRAVTYTKKRDFDRAIADLDHCITLAPAFAMAYDNRGHAHQDKGEFDQAIADYDRAIKLDPSSSNAYHNRGDAYHEKGMLSRALSDVIYAIKLKPDWEIAFNSLGNIYADMGDYRQAERNYEKAIEIKTNYPEPYYNLGNLYKEKGELHRALARYSQAIEIKADFAAAYNNRSDVNTELGHFDDAISDCNRALAIDPSIPFAYVNWGRAYAAKGNHDLAIADYDRSINLDPKLALAYSNRGIEYLNTNEVERGLGDLDTAIYLNPQLDLAYYNRGLALMDRGHTQNAIDDLNQTLKFTRNPIIRKRALRLLQEIGAR